MENSNKNSNSTKLARTVSANGLVLPVIGQGCWNIGDDPAKSTDEEASLRLGVSLGMNLIDTAEMYGDGASEELVGRAMRGIPRSEYMICTKVLPHNAGKERIFKSCDASLHRLRTDYIDLYLLHWRGDIPLEETVFCMEELVRTGKIRRWGVSNFDVADMEELMAVPGGENCAVDQVLYNLGSRGIEFDLLPWLKSRGIAVMAYCPLAQKGTLRRMSYDFEKNDVLRKVADKYGVTIWQIMLAFTIRGGGVMAIPKAANPAHVRENRAAADIVISAEDWALLDSVFWPPTSKMHLDIE